MNSEITTTGRSLALPMADERVIAQRPRAQRSTVLALEPGSPAVDAGVQIGDVLSFINGSPVLDIVDFAFLSAGENVSLVVERPEVGPVHFEINKGYDEDLGIEFGDDLFDKVHICKNKCVFCFLYQQPKGLRPTLYIKDDDYRLSFLHGNYLTLTNMGEEEFARVIEQKLSPLFVSVHATDPEVRGRMLGRKGPEPIIPRLRMLSEAKIQVHAQVVLCPGYNDGNVLERTVRELAQLHPEHLGGYGGVLSVAVVPVGLTQFRDRLAALKVCDSQFNRELVQESEVWRKQYRQTLSTNFVFLSDEIYLSAGVPVPHSKDYEGFPQLEDGVGLVRTFIDDLAQSKSRMPRSLKTSRSATLVTGILAAPLLQQVAAALNNVENVSANVCSVENVFFKGNISVAGLLTGNDVATSLEAMGDALGDRVIVPNIMLRDPDRDIFLDDMTLEQFRSRIGRAVHVVDRIPSAAIAAVFA